MKGFDSFASQTRSLGNDYRRLAERIPSILDRGVEASARAAFGDSQQYVPVDTGDLKQSGQLNHLSTAQYEILYTEDYAAAVETGHKTYTVRPVNAEALRFEVNGVVVYAQKADIPETEGVWYLKRAVEENRESVPRNISAEFNHAANQIFA